MRRYWRSEALHQVVPQSLIRALLAYRAEADHVEVFDPQDADLVGSLDQYGWQLPILDLDYPHRYVPSATDGHAHLFLDVPIRRRQWVVLMAALRYARVIEPGYFVWSLRRGQNFVRVRSQPDERYQQRQELLARYGWVRKRSP